MNSESGCVFELLSEIVVFVWQYMCWNSWLVVFAFQLSSFASTSTEGALRIRRGYDKANDAIWFPKTSEFQSGHRVAKRCSTPHDKVSKVCRQRKNSALGKTLANFRQNRQKSAMCVLHINADADVREGWFFSAFHWNWNFIGVHVNSVNSVNSVSSVNSVYTSSL